MSAQNHGALSTVNSILKPWSSIALLGMCSQQMPLILFWLWSPGVSGLRLTLGDKGQLCFHSREGSQAAPRLEQETQHPGTGSRGRGQTEELLKPALPLANMPVDGDEQLCTRGYSCPRTQTGPQSGAEMFMAMQMSGEGSRQGPWPHSGMYHNIYHICRGNGSQ